MPYRTGSDPIHAGWTALLLRDLKEIDGGLARKTVLHRQCIR
jgi:hypothetical protein